MTGLIFSAFVAGLLMFFAPCTLPLVPAYLAFISGIEVADIDKKSARALKWRVLKNGLFYVLGFSIVFILFGTLVAYLGSSLLGAYRIVFMKAGGILVMLFGLFMLGILKAPTLQVEKKFEVSESLKRGKPLTSFLLGAAFACGWTPCIGPILASILLVASTSTTALQGAILLAVFSLGMGIPFLLVAWGIGSAYEKLAVVKKYMPIISKVGGVFLIILGALLFMNRFGLLVGAGFQLFDFLGYSKLLQLL